MTASQQETGGCAGRQAGGLVVWLSGGLGSGGRGLVALFAGVVTVVGMTNTNTSNPVHSSVRAAEVVAEYRRRLLEVPAFFVDEERVDAVLCSEMNGCDFDDFCDEVLSSDPWLCVEVRDLGSEEFADHLSDLDDIIAENGYQEMFMDEQADGVMHFATRVYSAAARFQLWAKFIEAFENLPQELLDAAELSMMNILLDQGWDGSVEELLSAAVRVVAEDVA